MNTVTQDVAALAAAGLAVDPADVPEKTGHQVERMGTEAAVPGWVCNEGETNGEANRTLPRVDAGKRYISASCPAS